MSSAAGAFFGAERITVELENPLEAGFDKLTSFGGHPVGVLAIACQFFAFGANKRFGFRPAFKTE